MARAYQVYGGGFASGYFRDTRRVTNVVLKDEITPILNSLTAHSRTMGVEATRHVGFLLHEDIKKGIRRGSIDGQTIPNRKRLNMAGMLRLVNRFKTRKIKNGTQIRKYMLRITRRFMGEVNGGASLLQAVVYQKIKDVGTVVGWGSKTAPYWGAVVQKGAWGAPGSANKIGPQPVARGSKQWKFLAAIGMLPRGGKPMKRQTADFFGPFIRGREASGWIARKLNEDIARRLKKQELDAIARKTA